MKVDELKKIAITLGIKPGKMKKVELVHAIQQAEGNEQCFCIGNAAACGQEACLWREDCN